MINLDQIEEWIHEVEGRPASAPLIIRYVASRLRDLSARNEALLAENIELRTGRKVEDYESRIANLEYQLDLLKRQMGGGTDWQAPAPLVETINFLVYSPKGQVLRLEVPVTGLISGNAVASFPALPETSGLPRLLVTSSTEELLFVFDSGRAVTMPVSEVASAQPENMSWQGATQVEPHGNEELVTILPAARMTLYDCCVQISRRGCAKKMMKTAFESHVSKGFVGAGVKSKPDRTCNLVLCGKDDLLVLASREGYLWCLDVNQLPYTIEEVVKLSAIDYLATSFALNSGLSTVTSTGTSTGAAGQKAENKQTVLLITHNGKAINREASWLEKPASYKSRGQPVFSQARREAGARIVGAAVVDENDWGAALLRDGTVTVHPIASLLATGALAGDQTAEILEFVTFCAPGAKSA